MRILRVVLVVALALLLIVVALANRSLVSVRLLPANFDGYVNGSWSATMPLFLLIFIVFALGILVGLLWEWLRESAIRHENTRRARDIAQLEREVGGLRTRNAQPRDEVLAILDAPAVQTVPARPVHARPLVARSATTLPARR